MVQIVTLFDLDPAQAEIEQLLQRGDDLGPAMRAISGILADATDRAFITQTDPATGEPWAALKPSTANRRVDGRRRGERPILQVTGQLASSFRSEYGPDFAAVATNDPRAGTHHFGAARGAYGSAQGVYTFDGDTLTPVSVPIPFGDIPARPLVGVSSDDISDILDVVGRYIAQGGAVL